MWSLHVLSSLQGFPSTHWFPLTTQRRAYYMIWTIYIALVSVLVYVGALQWLSPPSAPNWNKQFRKDLSCLFLLIFIKCTYSSHLFQSLILEVLSVEIWWCFYNQKYARGAQFLFSCLYQLAYGTTGFVICHFALKSQFPNLATTLVRTYYTFQVSVWLFPSPPSSLGSILTFSMKPAYTACCQTTAHLHHIPRLLPLPFSTFILFYF